MIGFIIRLAVYGAVQWELAWRCERGVGIQRLVLLQQLIRIRNEKEDRLLGSAGYCVPDHQMECVYSSL